MNKICALLAAALGLAALLSLSFLDRVQASPAAPLPVTLTQPDGARIQVLPWGDEWRNGYEDLAGYTVLQDGQGWWVYARPAPDGRLVSAAPGARALVVGRDVPAELATHLRPAAAPSPLASAPQSIPSTRAAPEFHLPPASGDMKVLVLLAKFTDRSETYPATYFRDLVFGAAGSLDAFYAESSYGALNLVPAEEICGAGTNDGVADWRELPYAHPNTGTATTNANLQLVKDILTLNDDCVDYSSFDSDASGAISADELQVVVVVAGYERAYTFSTPSIWAHSYYLNFVEVPSLDGVRIGDYYDQSWYAQMGEIHGTSLSYHAATVGILAHEFGHLLNLPDLYDVDGSSEGVGRWSIMGSGGWNQTGAWPGDTPAHPDAWSKWYQGWLQPVEVTGSLVDVSIDQAEDHPQAYLLRPNPQGIDWIFNYHTGRGEYFLVENRQQVLSDAGLPGCGLLIWHINEKLAFNNYANALDATPLVSLEQADGLNQLARRGNRGDAGDPWPGTSGSTLFDHDSNPNSRRQDGGVGGVTVQVDSVACSASMQADLAYQLYTHTLLIEHKPDATCNAWETILSDDFESGNLDQWSVIDKNGTEYGEYYPAVSTCRPATGSRSAWLVGGGADGAQLECGDAYTDNAIPWMIHGPFSTLGETALRLDFSHWTYIEPAIPFTIYDRFCVWASDDNQFYSGYCFTGDWRGWNRYSFNLKDPSGYYNYLGKPQVWVAFSMMSDGFLHYPEGAYVDDINLRRCTSPAAGALSAGALQEFTPAFPVFPNSPGLDPFRWDWLTGEPTLIGPIQIQRD